jgi:uncharacterized protein YjbJ (UPF0337 family)
MALLEEMQVLVGDLEAAFSRRAGDERERLVVAAQDAGERVVELAGRQAEVAGMLGELFHGRMAQTVADVRERAGDERERLAVAAQDARERAAEMAGRQAEVAGMLGELFHGRMAQTVADARERAGNERERLAVAAQDAHERAAEMLGLAKIWTDHATAMGSLL